MRPLQQTVFTLMSVIQWWSVLFIPLSYLDRLCLQVFAWFTERTQYEGQHSRKHTEQCVRAAAALIDIFLFPYLLNKFNVRPVSGFAWVKFLLQKLKREKRRYSPDLFGPFSSLQHKYYFVPMLCCCNQATHFQHTTCFQGSKFSKIRIAYFTPTRYY